MILSGSSIMVTHRAGGAISGVRFSPPRQFLLSHFIGKQDCKTMLILARCDNLVEDRPSHSLVPLKLLAEKKEVIFRNNPFEARLKTHKLSGKLKDYYSFSVDYQTRIIFEIRNKNTIWFHYVGTHEIYR